MLNGSHVLVIGQLAISELSNTRRGPIGRAGQGGVWRVEFVPEIQTHFSIDSYPG